MGYLCDNCAYGRVGIKIEPAKRWITCEWCGKEEATAIFDDGCVREICENNLKEFMETYGFSINEVNAKAKPWDYKFNDFITEIVNLCKKYDYTMSSDDIYSKLVIRKGYCDEDTDWIRWARLVDGEITNTYDFWGTNETDS